MATVHICQMTDLSAMSNFSFLGGASRVVTSRRAVAQLDLVHGGHKQRSSPNRGTVSAKRARSVFVPEGLYERSLAVYCLE